MPKRIIDGLTYNTDTSTEIARSEWDAAFGDPEQLHQGTLYQTRGGAFFLIETWTEERRDADGEWVQRERVEWTPLSSDGARKWMLEGNVEVIRDPFGLDVPEAEGDEEPGLVTFSLRLPGAVKRDVEHAAKAAGLSMNAFAVRCLEGCAPGSKADAT